VEVRDSVGGNENTVTVTGACTTLNIAGNKNVITAAAVDLASGQRQQSRRENNQ